MIDMGTRKSSPGKSFEYLWQFEIYQKEPHFKLSNKISNISPLQSECLYFSIFISHFFIITSRRPLIYIQNNLLNSYVYIVVLTAVDVIDFLNYVIHVTTKSIVWNQSGNESVNLLFTNWNRIICRPVFSFIFYGGQTLKHDISLENTELTQI